MRAKAYQIEFTKKVRQVQKFVLQCWFEKNLCKDVSESVSLKNLGNSRADCSKQVLTTLWTIDARKIFKQKTTLYDSVLLRTKTLNLKLIMKRRCLQENVIKYYF